MNGARILVADRATMPGIVVITECGGEKTFRAYDPIVGARLLAELLAVLAAYAHEADVAAPEAPVNPKAETEG